MAISSSTGIDGTFLWPKQRWTVTASPIVSRLELLPSAIGPRTTVLIHKDDHFQFLRLKAQWKNMRPLSSLPGPTRLDTLTLQEDPLSRVQCRRRPDAIGRTAEGTYSTSKSPDTVFNTVFQNRRCSVWDRILREAGPRGNISRHQRYPHGCPRVHLLKGL